MSAATAKSRKHKATPHAREKFGFLHAAIADSDLSAAAKVVLVSLVLGFRHSKTGRCNPGMARIGKAVGRDRRNVIPAVAELRTRGWLKIATTKGGSKLNTNKYSFDFKQREPVTQTSPVMKTVPTSDVNAPRILEEPPAPKARGCVGAAPAALAPDGAAPQEKSTAPWESFQALCQIWRKPDGITVPAAWKAFQVVCDDHPAELVLESAARWVAKTEPRFLKRLEVWLGNGAWRNEPPARRAERTGRRGKEDPVEAMLRAGGWGEE